MSDETPELPATDWIAELSDEQCMEIFWLYVDPPEEFLSAHPPRLLGQAMRHALRLVAQDATAADIVNARRVQ